MSLSTCAFMVETQQVFCLYCLLICLLLFQLLCWNYLKQISGYRLCACLSVFNSFKLDSINKEPPFLVNITT